jgi:hypothetical protein
MSTTNIEFLGHPTHGGWHADSSHLNPKSIVYAFGVGDDITWDLALIEKYGCTIHAFDPDPHSNAWLAKQEIPPSLFFAPKVLLHMTVHSDFMILIIKII